jgi:pimeloyl-ACP methyl ester carboxylesterase
MTVPAPLSPLIAASRELRLADGRWLGYVEYGDPAGQPVFLFHGLPGSRLQHHPDTTIAARLGARLIALDRPGFGLSDPHHRRTLPDWPADVAALADHLGIQRFAVVGVSGGGPYAAVCAWRLAERLTSVGLVSSLAPGSRRGMNWVPALLFELGQLGDWALKPPAHLIAHFARRHPAHYLAFVQRRLPAADQRLFAQPAVRAMFCTDLATAFQRGPWGAIRDVVLLGQPWGFPLADIRVPVRLWHGERDTIVPVRMGRHLAATIPHCQARFLADAGHFLVIEHWRTILAEVLA